MDSKQKVLQELDKRLKKLQEHEDDEKPDHGNPFETMNHAVSGVISSALQKEITSIKDFVQEL